MSKAVMQPLNQTQAGDALRQQLARGDLALAGVAPVLSHLLASPGQALVSEDVVARMRGMLGDLAHQVIAAMVPALGEKENPQDQDEAIARFSGQLASSSVVVSHCYALAMESQLGERLEQEAAIDQVLTPLLQELIASSEESVAELAMATMSAQARFVQAQRRMDLPLGELPAELFHEVLALARQQPGVEDARALEQAEHRLRADYDESRSRLGLLARLVGSLGGGVRAALDLEHAGIALFASALARTAHQPRELAILCCHEQQQARLALALRAGGLKPESIARQFALIHQDFALPRELESLSPEEAIALLKGTAAGRRR